MKWEKQTKKENEDVPESHGKTTNGGEGRKEGNPKEEEGKEKEGGGEGSPSCTNKKTKGGKES